MNTSVCIKLTDSEFNPEVIMKSGQIFRMYKKSDGLYHVYSRDNAIVFKYDQANKFWRFYVNQWDWQNFWVNFFDLETDYSVVNKKIMKSKDDFLKKSLEWGKGMRILHQDLWETLISFIISQQNSIPKIQKTIEILCKNWGSKQSYVTPNGIQYFYSFPTPERIANLSLETLRDGTMLGYRAKYILNLSKDVKSNKFRLDKLLNKDYEETMKMLQSINGVGPKISNCVGLYGLHLMESYPIDVWMSKVITEDYPQFDTTKQYLQYINTDYKGFQGYILLLQKKFVKIYEKDFTFLPK